ncbi:MAG: protein phosphatase 2C domain-containing protein [Gammaproteobacteria bacterium]
MDHETGIANRLGNRAVNQDRCAALVRHDVVLLLLADGMGGHARGELAAQWFIDTMTRAFDHHDLPMTDPDEFLRQSIIAAHGDIVALGLDEQPPIYPRTTAVACLVQEGCAWWAHVGDSRLYLIRGGQVLTRTRDHTYVEELFQSGTITEAEMATHPMRNYVTYCLGGPQETPPVGVAPAVDLQPDDVLLLCSDGLWSGLDEAQMLAALGAETMQQAADCMADAADRATYPNSDNISVITMRVRADLLVDPAESQAGRSSVPTSSGRTSDQLDEAIGSIRDALREYHHELDGD